MGGRGAPIVEYSTPPTPSPPTKPLLSPRTHATFTQPTETPTLAKLKILGHRLSTPEPYSAGHCCSAAEASVLNAALTRGLAKGIYRELSEDAAADIESYIASFARGFAEGHERLKAIETAARQ